MVSITFLIGCIYDLLSIAYIYVSTYEFQQQVVSLNAIGLVVTIITQLIGCILICCSKTGRPILLDFVISGIAILFTVVNIFLSSHLLAANLIAISIVMLNLLAIGALCTNLPLRQTFPNLFTWAVSMRMALYCINAIFTAYFICGSVNDSFRFPLLSDINELRALYCLISIAGSIIWIMIFFKFLRPEVASYDPEGVYSSSIIFSKYSFSFMGMYLVALIISYIFWCII